MPRYVVERSFPEGLHLDVHASDVCAAVIEVNGEVAVTWVHSYVTSDKSKSFCIYDAPNPEAIRLSARNNHLPVDRITEVMVLDPYSYTETE